MKPRQINQRMIYTLPVFSWKTGKIWGWNMIVCSDLSWKTRNCKESCQLFYKMTSFLRYIVGSSKNVALSKIFCIGQKIQLVEPYSFACWGKIFWNVQISGLS